MVVNWIKVEGVVPLGRGHECLLAWSSGEVTSGWYIADGHFQHANGEMDYHSEDKVIYWADLPEHPLARAAEGRT